MGPPERNSARRRCPAGVAVARLAATPERVRRHGLEAVGAIRVVHAEGEAVSRSAAGSHVFRRDQKLTGRAARPELVFPRDENLLTPIR
jgi:hypothetical protein